MRGGEDLLGESGNRLHVDASLEHDALRAGNDAKRRAHRRVLSSRQSQWVNLGLGEKKQNLVDWEGKFGSCSGEPTGSLESSIHAALQWA